MDIFPEHFVLRQTEIGPLNNFLYVLADTQQKQAVLIDPAWSVSTLLGQIEELECELSAVWLTHGHPDHVNGLDDVLSQHDVPVFISEHEAPFYTPQHPQIRKIADRHTLSVGQFEFQCIHTPGHTPGSQSFYHAPILITGDAIFIDGCGRCDLPGGDATVQYNTLTNVIAAMPDETVLFTGHNYGPSATATLGDQKQTNPYLQATNANEFVHQRLGL
jgi:hydroxyacylglutathione hydrolase